MSSGGQPRGTSTSSSARPARRRGRRGARQLGGGGNQLEAAGEQPRSIVFHAENVASTARLLQRASAPRLARDEPDAAADERAADDVAADGRSPSAAAASSAPTTGCT